MVLAQVCGCGCGCGSGKVKEKGGKGLKKWEQRWTDWLVVDGCLALGFFGVVWCGGVGGGRRVSLIFHPHC